MRKILLTAFMAAAMSASWATDYITSLVVWTVDDVQTTYELRTLPEVSFRGSDLVIKSDGVETVYTKDVLKWFTFERTAVTGITPINADEQSLEREGDTIVLRKVKRGMTATVCTTDGKVVQQATAEYDGSLRLPINELPTGIYIVKTNGHTFKLMKR